MTRRRASVSGVASAKRLRGICLALPEAVEQAFGGHTTPTYRVRNKIFAMQPDDDDGACALWCKAAPGARDVLIGSDPRRFFAPPYVGPKGWIGVRLLAGTDWGLIQDMVRESYRMTAPKRLAAAVPPIAAISPVGAAPRRSEATPSRRRARPPRLRG